MATNAVLSGPTSKRVAENIAHWRKVRGYQQKDLSQRMTEVGRPMLPTVISKIERGDRRIDIDDWSPFRSRCVSASCVSCCLPPTPTSASNSPTR